MPFPYHKSKRRRQCRFPTPKIIPRPIGFKHLPINRRETALPSPHFS